MIFQDNLKGHVKTPYWFTPNLVPKLFCGWVKLLTSQGGRVKEGGCECRKECGKGFGKECGKECGKEFGIFLFTSSPLFMCSL